MCPINTEGKHSVILHYLKLCSNIKGIINRKIRMVSFTLQSQCQVYQEYQLPLTD